MNTRRILLLTEFGWGGVHTMTHTLTNALNAHDWQVTSLHYSQTPWSALIKAAKEHDVIVATHNFGPTYCGVALKILTGKTLVSWVHVPVLEVLRGTITSVFTKLGLKLLYKYIDQFVCASNTTQNSLLKLIRLRQKQRCTLIPHGIAPMPEGQSIQLHAGHDLGNLPALLLGYVGRLSLEKRPHLLLDTLRFLPEDAQLGIVGDGPLRSQIIVNERELLSQGRVHLLGKRPYGQSIYKLWRMTLLTSLYEGCSLAALESLACGVPCVSLPIPAMQELYGSDAPYLLAESDTPAALAQAVMTVFELPEEKVREDIARIVQRHHLKDFVRSWQEVLAAC